jgi:hypothetical protein
VPELAGRRLVSPAANPEQCELNEPCRLPACFCWSPRGVRSALSHGACLRVARGADDPSASRTAHRALITCRSATSACSAWEGSGAAEACTGGSRSHGGGGAGGGAGRRSPGVPSECPLHLRTIRGWNPVSSRGPEAGASTSITAPVIQTSPVRDLSLPATPSLGQVTTFGRVTSTVRPPRSLATLSWSAGNSAASPTSIHWHVFGLPATVCTHVARYHDNRNHRVARPSAAAVPRRRRLRVEAGHEDGAAAYPLRQVVDSSTP